MMAIRKLIGPLALGLSVTLFGASATVGSDPAPSKSRAAVSSGLFVGGVVTMVAAWRGFRADAGSTEA